MNILISKSWKYITCGRTETTYTNTSKYKLTFNKKSSNSGTVLVTHIYIVNNKKPILCHDEYLGLFNINDNIVTINILRKQSMGNYKTESLKNSCTLNLDVIKNLLKINSHNFDYLPPENSVFFIPNAKSKKIYNF